MVNSEKISKAMKILYPLGLAAVAVVVFLYIFNPKLDLNGDNCYYYTNATSLANGDGYADMFGEPTTNFPPGYPLLMTPLRMITDSIIAQKIQNLIFLFMGVLLLYHTLVRLGFRGSHAFVSGVAVLLTPHVLDFSTMMMSEASCIFFISLSFWLFTRLPDDDRELWRMPCFYLFLASVVFTYYIRTQAVAFVAAFALALLLQRRWRFSLAVVIAFATGVLPWAIRNEILGLEQSRYLSQVDFSDILSTIEMLVVKAIPESVVPFIDVNYKEDPSLLLWAFALVWLAVIIYGMWNMGRLRFPLLFFLVGTIAVISIIDTPSQYRYMVIVLPFITAALLAGLWRMGTNAVTFLSKGRLGFSSWFLMLLLIPLFLQAGWRNKHTLYDLRTVAVVELPSRFQNFFEAGNALYRKDKSAVVATRKPELLYVGSKIRGRHFLETNNDKELIRDLLLNDVNYVMLDQLGVKATIQYLYPCVKRHPDLFRTVVVVPNPDTYLIYFDRKKAEAWLLR